MTRAKDRLYLVHARHRSTWGVGAAASRSRFLAELPEELLEADRRAAARPTGAAEGGERRGTDDDGWLPGGYRAPCRGRVYEQLRPVYLPDMAPPGQVGRELDAARNRVAAAGYAAGEELDLGSGAFELPAATARSPRAGLARRRQGPASALRRRDRRHQPLE